MQRFFSNFIDGTPGIGLLILRFVMGMGMMAHGWGKIKTPFSWMDKPGAPSAIPDLLQALAALGEFGGGLAIVLGFLTPLGALGVLCTMIGAWFIAHRDLPWLDFTGKGKSFEYAALYGAVALTLLLTGPGRFSLDALIWGKKKRRI